MRWYVGGVIAWTIVFLYAAYAQCVPAPVAAIPATSLLNSIGVNSHGVSAKQVDFMAAKHVRGGTWGPLVVADWIKLCTTSHADIDLLDYALEGSTGMKSDAAALFAKNNLDGVNCLHAIEGANEPNNFLTTWPEPGHAQCCRGDGSYLPAVQRQAYVYKWVHDNYPGIPVYHVSEAGGPQTDNAGLQFNTIPQGFNACGRLGSWVCIPDGTKLADFANLHNYLQWPGEPGHISLVENHAWFTVTAAPSGVDGINAELVKTWRYGYPGYTEAQAAILPKVTTETGFASTLTVPPPGGFLTYDQQGKLYVNLLLDGIKMGFSETYFYLAVDEDNNGMGLFNAAGEPKPAATFIHNLAAIMADKNPIASGSFSYIIENPPPTVHEQLFQKSNGTYWLAVWNEHTSLSGLKDNVKVTFASPAAANLYDPTVGVSPVQAFSKSASIPLSLSDHAVILEVLADGPPG